MGPHPRDAAPPAATLAGGAARGPGCVETADVGGSIPGVDFGVLICVMPEGHASDLHYDSEDDISWKAGRPDE